MGPIICWRAGDDPVEVPGVSLRLHQRFAAAIGTAHEVGATSATRLECHDNIFGNVGSFLERSITEIDHLLRVAYSPRCVDATALMAIIGPRYRVTSAKRLSHTTVTNRSAETATP